MVHRICLTLLFSLGIGIRADIFMAIVELEQLLETHQKVKDQLNHYIKKEEQRLSILRRYSYLYEREHKIAMKDISAYVGNPIKAYLLIKRLTFDLDYLNYNINIKPELDFKNLTRYHKNITYPTIEDLMGAAKALTKIQETYKLDIKDLAAGRLNSTVRSSPMTACDCFKLGRVLYQQKNFANGLEWILEAFIKYKEERMNYPFTAFELIEHISFGYIKLGDLKSSQQWIQKILDRDPRNSRARHMAQICKNKTEAEKYKLKATLVNKEDEERRKKYAAREEAYHSLCRGDMELPTEISSRLTCRYLTENDPFLKLAPFKIEMLYINPDVVLFHDVLTDVEIETLKKMATNKLQRSQLHDPKRMNASIKDLRISKSAWIDGFESDMVTYMTGLSTESAEKLQVVNYGIGGYFALHHDFVNNVSSIAKEAGNRIATVLFYLQDTKHRSDRIVLSYTRDRNSQNGILFVERFADLYQIWHDEGDNVDNGLLEEKINIAIDELSPKNRFFIMSDVTQGGATVFPTLSLSVIPRKGTAIFWYNMHATGECNLAMLHAACPVLQGSKWISTMWIHEIGQELKKPCNLTYEKDQKFLHSVL